MVGFTAIPPRMTPYPRIEGWVGCTAGVDGRGKFRSQWDSIPRRSSQQKLSILTELPGPYKGQIKVHPATGHESPESGLVFSSTLSLTSALYRGWVVNATPPLLYRWERPGTYYIGGWVGPRAGLTGCGKISPRTGIRFPGCYVRSESLYRLSYSGPHRSPSTFIFYLFIQ
jgi:hypothetical protein